MQYQILCAQFSHESTTFVDGLTGKDAFEERSELYGAEIPEKLSGTNTEVGGVIEVADELDLDVHYSVVADAEPGGPVAESTYRYFSNYITDAVKGHETDLDGIILPLHGAMVPEHLDSGEGPLVTDIRAIVGSEIPIVVTIDPNANVSDELVEMSDAIIAYETTPHVDMKETGQRATRLLYQMMAGEVDPVQHIERPPVLPSAVRSTTLEPPLSRIAERARELEERTEVLKVNVCQGFWSADVPYMGFSIVAVTDGNEHVAKEVARDVSERVWNRREEFVEDTMTADEAVEQARELATHRDDSDGPVVIAEMHDNPGGGRPGDGTKVLRALLNQNASNAGLAILHDPEAVSACVSAGVGERVELSLGGQTGDPAIFGEPLDDIDGYVKAITDGRFVNTGPMKTDLENDFGTTVRFECGTDDAITVVLTENRLQPFDTEIWRHVGIQPERLDILAVKSAVHYRADYSTITDTMISVDESPDREYSRIKRPQFPIDEMDDADYPHYGGHEQPKL